MNVRIHGRSSQRYQNIFDRSVIDFGLLQTELYYNSLKNCLELLDDNPDMGSVADDIQPGYRRFSHQSHVIFYRAIRGWYFDRSHSAQTYGYQ